MDQYSLQQLINRNAEISITYRRERDELIKNYNLNPVEIKTEYLKDGTREVYLYATKIPKRFNSKVQKFILNRILSATACAQWGR